MFGYSRHSHTLFRCVLTFNIKSYRVSRFKKSTEFLKIKATEIVESSNFKAGYTLRFPRVEKVRYDKPWYDCLTTTELEEMHQVNSCLLVDTDR